MLVNDFLQQFNTAAFVLHQQLFQLLCDALIHSGLLPVYYFLQNDCTTKTRLIISTGIPLTI